MENPPSQASSLSSTGTGANAPVSGLPVLQKSHDDLDILLGCPRSVTIGGVTVTVKAFKNDEFSRVAVMLAHYGFFSCETEADVDAITIDEIYTNLVIQGTAYLLATEYNSLQDFLFSFIQWPEGSPTVAFEDVSDSEFRNFLAILIEQNNLINLSKKNMRRTLKALQSKTSKT